MQYNLLFYRAYSALCELSLQSRSSVREKMLGLGVKFVSSIIHAFFSRAECAEFPVYNRKSMVRPVFTKFRKNAKVEQALFWSN